MILRTAFSREVESRDMFVDSSRVPPPGQYSGGGSVTGQFVDYEMARSLPAAGRAVRLLAETVGQLELAVFQREPDKVAPKPAIDSPQWAILHDRPNFLPWQSPFVIWSYAIASMLRGGAGFLKTKDRRGRVVELFLMDPRKFRPKLKNGVMTFKVREGNQMKTLSTSDVIYVPGLLSASPHIGCSIFEDYANTVGVALAQQDFEGRFYANDATPNGLIRIPGNPNKDRRDEFRDSWESRHGGVYNSHRVGLLWAGAEYEAIGISLRDAQFIEAQKFSIAQLARITGVPRRLLEDEVDTENPELENLRFLTYGVGPWIQRLAQGLHADDDLFPDKRFFPRFLTNALLRGDFRSRAQGYREARQGGWLTANEIRGEEGWDAHPDGDVLQKTPVGGAPNAHVSLVDDFGGSGDDSASARAGQNGHGDSDRLALEHTPE